MSKEGESAKKKQKKEMVDFLEEEEEAEKRPTTLKEVLVSEQEFIETISCLGTRKILLTKEQLRGIYHKYWHPAENRVWTAAEIRRATNMLQELGFGALNPVELNLLLPAASKLKNGEPIPEANVFVWPQCAQELGIDMKSLEAELDSLSLDKVKWSRRAPKTKGKQTKRARWNCCFTDLKDISRARNPDKGDSSETFVKHKHPKNNSIKFTNFAFKAVPQLDLFRQRFAAVLGPFGYKFREQFAELNAYYNTSETGIGRHGDLERGLPDGCGAVNCLKVGEKIPLLFSWYKDTKPIGLTEAQQLPVSESPLVSFPLVKFSKPKWPAPTTTAAAVIQAGEGLVYMMSDQAIGQNWKQRDFALRHCAGASKYTGLPAGPPYEPRKGQRAYSITFSDQVENDSESPELQFASPWFHFACHKKSDDAVLEKEEEEEQGKEGRK